MAATTAFPTLSAPATEDIMEVSSPANQVHYNDIDLDFGDGEHDGGVDLLEDEPMLTDGEQARPQTATDDMMDDDDVQDTTLHVHEAEMQDTLDIVEPPPNEPYDEELIDYGDDEDLGNPHAEDNTLIQADEGFNTFLGQPVNDVEEVDEEIVRQPEDVSAEHQDVVDDFAGYDFVADAAAHVGDMAGQSGTGEAAVHAEAFANEARISHADGDGDDAALAAEEEDEQSFEEAAAGEEPTGHPGITVDTTLYPPTDAPPTPTDTGLHPVTLYYGEHAMPLFKSKHQPDGLLKNDNLAHVHLHDLMSNCRERLALRIDNVPEVQDFTLAFDHLGLMLAGKSTAAFLTSLTDVLEVYLHLHRNDGTHDIPPLSLILTHDQFTSQLAMLKQAAEIGTGMSHFVSRSEEEEYEEEEDEGDLNGDGLAEDEQTFDQQEQHGDVDSGEADTEAKAEAPGASEVGGHVHQPEEEYYQGEEYEDDEDDAEAQEQEHREGEVYDEGLNGQQASHVLHEANVVSLVEGAQQPGPGPAPDTAALAEADGLDESNESAAIAHQPSPSGEEPRGYVPKAASTVSSETVKGDSSNDSIGEYDGEDLIDLDDDSDLTHVPSEQAADGQDEFATFLAEHDAEEAKAARDAHDEQTAEQAGFDQEDAFAKGGEHPSADQYAAGDDEQDLYLGSEDLLNAEAYEDHAADAQKDGTGDAEHDGQYQEHDSQADTHEEQHEAAYQEPGEDEQFNAAHDFEDEGVHEHGLEHQPNGGEGHVGLDENATTEIGYQDQRDTTAEEPFDLEDDIGFDDETTEQHEARKASHPRVVANGTGSPLGKRSFDEHTDDEFGLDEEPEAKKVRAV
ncbi:hypothetical protein B0A55_07919 [Friedmanniomyces simplex]|uniref:Uncharacterized protein n=1 Tax=Friedmanniomyces simplex TaxID=329884 RepID=A0A4V5NG51_9PEZI|nr:hypothetical protein B0A55_07919 [Friedmanniomyces simplex]